MSWLARSGPAAGGLVEVMCSRVMREIFGDLQGVSVYLDDLLIHAEDKQKHDEILKIVLSRIRMT